MHVKTLYLCLFQFLSVHSSLTEAEIILNRIIEGDSDLDLSEDESPIGEAGEGESSDEEPDEVDQDTEPAGVDQEAGPAEVCHRRRPLWAKTNMYISKVFNQNKSGRITCRDVFQEIDPNTIF